MSNPSASNATSITHGCTTATMRERFGQHWSKVGTSVCAKEGCERPSTGFWCGQCYAKALGDVQQLPAYRAWLPGWQVKERQMSNPSFRACGAVTRGQTVRDA